MKQPAPNIEQRLAALQKSINALNERLTDTNKLFLKVREVGERIGYGKADVYDLIRTGGLPAVQLTANGQFLIPAKALEEWAEQQIKERAVREAA